MSRTKFLVCLAIICSLCFPCLLWAHIPADEGTESLIELGGSAAFIFHATVLSFDSVRGKFGDEYGFVNLAVDRWYKGKPGPATVRMGFQYPGFISGSDCINFHRASSWLIFANRNRDGSFQFSDTCEGGLPMSSIIGPPTAGTWMERLQRDLIDGLQDGDPAVRLANIARLGGLKMKSSGAALRDFAEHGSELESKWAVYAAFRSGDMIVLPQVESIVISLTEQPPPKRRAAPEFPVDAAPTEPMRRYAYPDIDIVLAFRWVVDLDAVPSLSRIATSAKDELVRKSATSAISEMKRILATEAHDLNPGLRPYSALVRMEAATHDPACKVPPKGQIDPSLEDAANKCKQWWNEIGSTRPWVGAPIVQ